MPIFDTKSDKQFFLFCFMLFLFTFYCKCMMKHIDYEGSYDFRIESNNFFVILNKNDFQSVILTENGNQFNIFGDTNYYGINITKKQIFKFKILIKMKMEQIFCIIILIGHLLNVIHLIYG